jgi:hypothetical protein
MAMPPHLIDSTTVADPKRTSFTTWMTFLLGSPVADVAWSSPRLALNRAFSTDLIQVASNRFEASRIARKKGWL